MLRYEGWYLFVDFARALADALLCASAGYGFWRTLPIVEPACRYAPIRSSPPRLMIAPCLARLGDFNARYVLGATLRSLMTGLLAIRFCATSFLGTAAVTFLVRRAVRARHELQYLGNDDRTIQLAAFSSHLIVGQSAAVPHPEGATRWRAADQPVRHTMRMAAWNAPGWPDREVLPLWRVRALPTVWELGTVSAMDVTGDSLSAAPAEQPAAEPETPIEVPPAIPSTEVCASAPTTPISTATAPFRLTTRTEPPSASMMFGAPPEVAAPAAGRHCDFDSDCPADPGPALSLSNRFGALEVEVAEAQHDLLPADDFAQPPGRPPGASRPCRGPRAPREVRDMESHLMRPVPMRKRTESARVLAAHASFLQYWFRRTKALAASRQEARPDAPSAWSPGGMRGLLPFYRPVLRTRCTDGIAGAADFESQRRRARRVLMWYRQYSELLRKLMGRQPELVDLFCGEGGVSEGIRRAGLASTGVDLHDMPRFRRRFGAERFVQADAYLPSVMHDAVRRLDAVGVGASPPCQPYSTILADGDTATAAPGIPQVAASLRGLGLPFWVENVLGADANELEEQMTVLRGPMFGLPVDRGRRFWTSFDFHLDSALSEGGMRLRQRCCLGPRRRWMRLDPFGRPIRTPCCHGNLYPVQGRAPTRSTAEENARAMGVDEGHMSWNGLAQSIPPDMAELISGQLAMAVAAERYGAPRITFDDLEARPTWARRLMRRWLRGAGDDSRDAGLEIVAARAAVDGEVAPVAAEVEPASTDVSDPRWRAPPEPGAPPERPSELALWNDVRWGLPEADWREVYYSHAGGYTRSVLDPGAPWWLGAMHLRPPCAPAEVTLDTLVGENTFVHCSTAGLDACWPSIRAAALSEERGTRVTIVVPREGHGDWERRAHDAGLFELPAASIGISRCDASAEVPWGSDGLARRTLEGGYRIFTGGTARYASSKTTLDHDDAEPYMDPRDRGIGCEEPERKVERSYQPIPHDPARWLGKGFSPFVEQLMTEGHRIGGDEPFGFYEIDQYKWKDATAQRMGGIEADRHVLLGALEYVSASEAAVLLASSATVHPWTVVHQRDKWRACQDYSKGTNLEADTVPFRLPTVFDVRHVIKPDSHFAKWDLRDGFFHVPIHPSSRNRMLVRHPVSGLLMRCLRLPFGYVDSPRCFCGMTEAVAQKFRERVARAGVRAHMFVYVDDALVVGDTEEDTRRASRIFEALLAELGLQWAPHKRRGPAQVIEFLGLLLCNHASAPRCIALTRRRQSELRVRLDSWLARRPARGSAELHVVDPRELAVLLGNLVFASQVMPNARVYLQGMLASFIGLEVEWKRGKVRAVRGAWRPMTLSDAFWRDLDWWDQQLERNNCVPISPPPRARAAVQAGTDASDFGAGELIYLGGQREETRLKFTRAEQRRPINWRELLGIFRVVEVWGARLHGCRLLVETDNTVAWATGTSGHSKAAEMQELLRRLCETCARHDIELSLTHQPGVKLDRPDQVSRGSAAEEPRARLCRGLFETVAARFGPFTEFLGAEREFGTPGHSGAQARCFVHSSHSTVGSALRLVGERLRDSAVGSISGVVVVPFAPEALWWKMMKHFSVVAHLGCSRNRPHLEANTLSSWRPLASQRESLIVVFPRSAGIMAHRLHLEYDDEFDVSGGYKLYPPTPSVQFDARGVQVDLTASGSYVAVEWPGLDIREREEQRWVLPVPKGTVLYSRPRDPNGFGALYLVAENYDPTTLDEAYGPLCFYLLRDDRPSARKAPTSRVPVLIDSKESLASGGALHQPDGDELFVVTNFVTRRVLPTPAPKGWRNVTDYFEFNQQAAANAIASLLGGTACPASPHAPVIDPDAWVEDSREHFRAALSLVQDELPAPKRDEPPMPHERNEGADPAVARGQEAPDFSGVDPASEWVRLLPNGVPDLAGLLPKGDLNVVTRSQRGIGQAPECGYEGCPAHCVLLADQRSYSPYCTGEVHPPIPRPECALTGCTARCHPTPDYLGFYQYCGHTHGRAGERRAREVVPPPAVSSGLSRLASGAGSTQIARSAGITCRGCRGEIRMGAKMEVHAEGFIHPTFSCRAAAASAPGPSGTMTLADIAADPISMAVHLQKKARVAEMLSDRRMVAIRRCADGVCPLGPGALRYPCGDDRLEPTMVCRGGCKRTLHAKCAEISKGYVQKGAFTCHHCRLAAMGAEGEPHDSLILEVCRQVAVEMTEGRESTSVSHSSFVALSEKWVTEMLSQGLTRVASPTENAESFRQFALWVVTTAGRERSFATIWRAAAGYFEAAGKTNFTKLPQMKALFRELDDMIGSESQPATHGTRRMLLACLRKVLEKRDYLRVRETVLLVNEGVGCLRAGESCGAVEGHGLSANDCFVLSDINSRELSVELKLHDSKTHFPRYINMAGTTTTSQIEVASAYMRLFSINALTLRRRREGNFDVISPDSFSVKLSLLGMPEDFLIRLKEALTATYTALFGPRHGGQGNISHPGRQPEWNLLTRLLQYAEQAQKATTGGTAHKYVLLNEGPSKWVGHTVLMRSLARVGLGKINEDIHLVPAPLLRATHLGGKLLTPMPLTYDTANTSMKSLFEHAVQVSSPPGDPDPELDLQGHAEAHWGQHSWRRMGEKTARDDQPQWSRLGLTKDDVDLYSGWEGKKLSENMQIHYAGQQRDHRVKRCAITRST